MALVMASAQIGPDDRHFPAPGQEGAFRGRQPVAVTVTNCAPAGRDAKPKKYDKGWDPAVSARFKPTTRRQSSLRLRSRSPPPKDMTMTRFRPVPALLLLVAVLDTGAAVPESTLLAGLAPPP